MANDFLTIVHTTTSNFLRQAEENIFRNRKLMALLKKKGRITYNVGGKDMDWKVRYKRADLRGFADGDGVEFSRNDRHKTATLDWRAYVLSDYVSKHDRLKNKGPAAIIEVFANMANWMMEDIEEGFADELYSDGTASTRKIHGIETIFQQSGAIASTPFRNPSGTYAGLSMVPAAYGGSWSSALWPLSGRGQTHYDFWSPLMIDYGSTYWTASGNTFRVNGADAIRLGLITARRSKSKKGMPDLIDLTSEMYRQFASSQASKEQINVNRGQGSGLVSLGFDDVINFDGCDVTWEYGMPDSTGYIMNTNHWELCSQQANLFEADGPEWNQESKGYRFSIDFFGNMKINPRTQGKLYQYTGP